MPTTNWYLIIYIDNKMQDKGSQAFITQSYTLEDALTSFKVWYQSLHKKIAIIWCGPYDLNLSSKIENIHWNYIPHQG